jgi:hypothetical protein
VDNSPMPLTPQVLHLNQVQLARRWALSPRTLERWRFHGTGPGYLKVGGRVLYRLTDVEAFEAVRLNNINPPSISQQRGHAGCS